MSCRLIYVRQIDSEAGIVTIQQLALTRTTADLLPVLIINLRGQLSDNQKKYFTWKYSSSKHDVH